MDILELMEQRHSVRKYLDKPIPTDKIEPLVAEMRECNAESGLRIVLYTNDPSALGGFKGKISNFRNAVNYFAMLGPDETLLDEKCGWYGERLVLKAQELGLDTCWIAGSYGGSCRRLAEEGERLSCIISVGFGETQGVPHKNKQEESRFVVEGDEPEWFARGRRAVMLAPTAINQQKFRFTLRGGEVFAEETGGFYSNIDLGIVKYHFFAATGVDCRRWDK